jgi:hypothetical protein
MKKLLICLAAMLAATNAEISNADIVMSGLTHTENFDSLVAPLPSWPESGGSTHISLGSTGFVGAQIGGTGTAAFSMIAGNGSGNAGGIYSFGATSDSDRALGVLASGTRVMGFGVRIVNASGIVWKDVTVSFTQENWRGSTTSVNTVDASWAVNFSDPTSFLNSATGFTDVSPLNLVGPAPVQNNGALDGNNPLNQVSRTHTFSGINLAVGDSLFLRWRDFDFPGADAGLAIDNFSISATAVPEPTSLALLGVVGVGGLAARRFRKKHNSNNETIAA